MSNNPYTNRSNQIQWKISLNTVSVFLCLTLTFLLIFLSLRHLFLWLLFFLSFTVYFPPWLSSDISVLLHVLLDDPFEHVGSILVNISKKEAGRVILLDPKRGLLKQIIMQFDSTSLLRKRGVCYQNSCILHLCCGLGA